MGQLINGKWHIRPVDTSATGGRFVRANSVFRNWITPDGSRGPAGDGGFAAEEGRYQLYVSYACPWAHRTLILRTLKGLEGMIGVTVSDAFMGDEGWTLGREPDTKADLINGATRLYELYLQADSTYTGRVTVPVLWDCKRRTIVSNESADIIRMFNSAFNHLLPRDKAALDFYPAYYASEIDETNAMVYDAINNGVYKAGFAGTQGAYDEVVYTLFNALDKLEDRLGRQRYLAGPQLTEADWRLFTTLVRFDPVYVGHFKCNLRRIADYPHLSQYLRDLYQVPGIAETVNFDHIKRHYYQSHTAVNPTGIVPAGPEMDLTAPHDRARLT